jgi:hypothetical protein
MCGCNQDKITDKAFQNLPASLTYLKLSYCQQTTITDAAFQNLPVNLTGIAMIGCKQMTITHRMLRNLPAKLSRLCLDKKLEERIEDKLCTVFINEVSLLFHAVNTSFHENTSSRHIKKKMKGVDHRVNRHYSDEEEMDREDEVGTKRKR